MNERPKWSHWDEDPKYPVADWRTEVFNDDTRQSYAEWVDSQRETANNACATWRESPSMGTAATYLLATLQYVNDGMLSDKSLYAAVEEVGQWLISMHDERSKP